MDFQCVDLQLASLLQRIRKSASQCVIPIENAPGRLHRRIEEAIASRSIPEGVQTRAQSFGYFEGPIQRRRFATSTLELLLCFAIE